MCSGTFLSLNKLLFNEMFKSSKQMENSGGRVGNPTWMCICIYPKHIYIMHIIYKLHLVRFFIHEIFISTKLSARRAPSTRFPPPGCSWWCSDLAPWSSGSHWSLEGNLFSKRSSQKKNTHTKNMALRWILLAQKAQVLNPKIQSPN